MHRSIVIALTLAAACATEPAESTATEAITITIVATGQTQMRWGQSTWDTPATISLPSVQAGDAILVLGMYWTSASGSAKPSDTAGALTAAVNQAPTYRNPPVGVQIYYELNASAGTHTIKPPNLGFGGDGTLYVLQVRGLSTYVSSAQNHANGTDLPSILVSTTALAGDFVVAVGGEDDEVDFGPNAGMSGAPSGWSLIGWQQNASVNVPSAAYMESAAADGAQSVTWTWADTTANVTGAGIAVFR